MSHKPFSLAAIILVLVLVTACSGPRSVSLTAADNGSKVELQAGGQITVKLDSNPSTGYTWEASGLDASMFSQVGEAVFSSSNPGLVGSGGTLTLTFDALKSGTSTLALVYQRPWDTGVAPIRTFSVTITVK